MYVLHASDEALQALYEYETLSGNEVRDIVNGKDILRIPEMEEEEEEPVTEEESPIVNVSEEEVSNGAMPESENNKE